jgi:hypothetical protein
VFGILKRGGKVHALPVADASGPTLLTALQTKVWPMAADSPQEQRKNAAASVSVQFSYNGCA